MLNTLLGRRRPSQKPSNGPPPSKAAASNLRSKTSTNETIDSLVKMRQTIQDLEKRESFLSIKAKAQHEEALAKTKAGDKQGAVAALTRKKMFEKEGEFDTFRTSQLNHCTHHRINSYEIGADESKSRGSNIIHRIC